MVGAVYLSSSGKGNTSLSHPWIYPKRIDKIVNAATGDLVKIHTSDGLFKGYGIFNEHSLYRVRILWLDSVESPISLQDIVQKRLNAAQELRTFLDLPNEKTNAYRLFNSESDGLSGLTIDVFGDYLTVSSTAFWVEKNRSMIESVLKSQTGNKTIIWLSQEKSLAQDGWIVSKEPPVLAKTVVKESGIEFSIVFETAQKTGLFLDQRENHERVAALAKDKTILDLYTYTGGFALHAAKAGAKKVVAVDSSEAAIERANENAVLNQLTNIEWVTADARDYLINASDYDIVILDPPKLVPSRRHLEKAKNYYRFLHRELFKVMKSGSILVTCNCSSAISSHAFTELIADQAAAMDREVQMLGVFGPSMCHPVKLSFPEGQYLTVVYLRII